MTSNNKTKGPERITPRTKIPFEKWSLVVFTFGTGALVFLALLNLITGTGAIAVLKASIMAGSAMLVSYAVNRFAIEKGTELTATGFTFAGVVSVFSMLIVGIGLYAATYSGLTISSVGELQLQEHGSKYARIIAGRNRSAAEAGRLVPVVRANEAELVQYVECEERESCISRRGDGGRGTVTRALEQKARRANTIVGQLEAGEIVRQSALASLNKLLARYQKTLGQTDKPLEERRQQLVGITAEIDQTLSTLDEALPVTLLRAYANELETGVIIAERPVATKAINAILAKHAQSLNLVLSTLTTGDQNLPTFPPRAGVSSTFKYIGHFLPIAILTAAIELIFPLTLWTYVLLGIVWAKYQADPPHRPQQNGGKPGSDNNPNRKPNRNRRRNERRRNNHKRGE